MACAQNLVRYLFFLFNLIIWILGIVVLAVGIYSRVENDSWKDLIKMDTLLQAANLLIAAGLIVAVLGFLGCCGAIKKIQWMLVIYSLIVFLIFILEVAAGAYAYTKREKVEQKLTEGVQKGIAEIYGKGDKSSLGMSLAIDYFQQEVKCCGAAGPADWLNSYWHKQNTTGNSTDRAQVPQSCCRTISAKCNVGVNENSTSIYNKGCIEAGKEFVEGNLKLIGGVGVVIGIIELFGIVFAMCLCSAFRREERGDPID